MVRLLNRNRATKTKAPYKFILIPAVLFIGIFIPALFLLPSSHQKRKSSAVPHSSTQTQLVSHNSAYIDEGVPSGEIVGEYETCADGHGIFLTEGGERHCVCTALWSGPNCQEGDSFKLDESLPPISRPQGFTSEITMSKKWLRELNSDIKIHLPGKTPAWRLIGKVKDDLISMVPDTDPVTQWRFNKCAVVGNSGVLLSTTQGKAIDSHDMILRFNGAPTKGLEENVGTRTDIRIVNSKWVDFRESWSEYVLWNMRAPGSLDFYKERRKEIKKENFFIFNSEWVNYVAQMGVQLSKSFTGEEGEVFKALSEEGYTPTSGFTGILIAVNLCRKVTLYGMQISETQGFPYHYHNKCPQPYGGRDEAEWLMIKRMVDLGLIAFNEPCIPECRSVSALCDTCRSSNPEFYSPEARKVGEARWDKNPMPPYCASRAELLQREKLRIANGGNPYTKDERSTIMTELELKSKAAGSVARPDKKKHSRT